MIPVEGPSGSSYNAALEHLRTLQDNFNAFDTAKEKVQGKPWIGGGPDHIVSNEDLQNVADDTQHQHFNAASQEAARYLLDHPELLARLDTASAAGAPEQFFDQPDGRIGQQDVNAGVRDAANFAGAQTFHGEKPSIPMENRTDEQQAAFSTLASKNLFWNLYDVPDASQQQFVQNLKAHKDDAAWLQHFFGALGARNAGSLLHDSLSAGGESRTAARDALDSLFGAGKLNATDLGAGQFKTTPSSSDSFSLQTLVDADRVQRQVEARRDRIAGTDSQPVDTSQNDAYDALLTVRSASNADDLGAIANRYGIDPALLKGAVASEMDFDYNTKDQIQDGMWRNTAVHVNVAPGITSVRTDALQWGAKYLKDHQVEGADAAQAFLKADPERDNGADFDNSAEAAAIVLAAITHVRKSHGASTSTPTDMAVTWGAFRSGIRDVMPGGSGYSLDEFLHNKLAPSDAGNVADKSGDPHTLIGGNAYQSEPYFAMLARQG
jgi:hypothetical protein